MTDETKTGGFEERLRVELQRHHPGPDFPEREMEREIEARMEAVRSTREGKGGAPVASRRDSADVLPLRRDVRWWQRGPVTGLLSAAAALLVFIGGVEYGRRGIQTTGIEGPVATVAGDAGAREGALRVPGSTESVSLPLSIQSAGSEYVATLARFSGTSNQLPDEQREIAREVAMTVLYGAALELLEAIGDDQLLEQLVSEIGRRRFQTDGEGTLLPGTEL